MTATLPNVAYIVASILFIMSLKGLSQPETSRRGNTLGTIGMILAILVTAARHLCTGQGRNRLARTVDRWACSRAAIAVGCVIGAILAARVAMTQMPELVAMLHSFVGLAAVLVGIVSKMQRGAPGPARGRRARGRGRDRRLRRRGHVHRLRRRVPQAARDASAGSRCSCPAATC